MPKPAPSRRKSSRPPATRDRGQARPAPALDWTQLLDALPLAAFAALCVATCLVPPETPPAAGHEIPLVMCWLLLLGTWAVLGMLRRELVLRFDLASAALLVFFLWLCLSSAVNLSDARPRATINMTCRWLSFGVMFFLARQLLDNPRRRRAMIAAMLALATGVAALGTYQYAVVFPSLRAGYEAEPAAAMQAAGVFAPVDSPAGQQFRDRVFSVEPLSTFALTNSLAGFLTPWLIVALAAAWICLSRPARGGPSNAAEIESDELPRGGPPLIVVVLTLGGLLVALQMTAFCLLLTKSRSAWGAVALGLLLLFAGALAKGLQGGWKWLLGGGAAMAVLIAAAALTGGIDREVFSEAFKSLAYRIQYWQATLAMIADHWLFGVGVGNFQERYAAYKLPAASEMIGDPHNFPLEIAATMGLPALVPLGVALAAIGGYALRPQRPAAGPAGLSPAERLAGEASAHQAAGIGQPAVLAGVIAGFFLAVPLQLMTTDFNPTVFLVAAPVTGLTLAALWGWIHSDDMHPAALGVAWLALLVNLLAAGGIGFASVSLQVWLLAAMIAGSTQRGRLWQLQRRGTVAALVVVALLTAVFYLLAYRPVLHGRIDLQVGEMLLRQAAYREAIEPLESAAASDPLNDEPFRLLAIAHQRLWIAEERPGALERFEALAAQAVARNPHSHVLRADLSQRFLELYRASGDSQWLTKALEHQQAALERYPNDALGRAQLAWLLSLAGRSQEARQEALRALRLDVLNPHAERKLAAQKLFDTHGNLPADQSAWDTLQPLAHPQE